MTLQKLIYICCFLISAWFPVSAYGQYYSVGQDPASLKWRQIETPHFRFIYPESFESKAHEMVKYTEFVYSEASKSLSYKPKQIPFIIHNYNSESNAVTVWTPRRVELYTCPPQDSYAQDWLKQLMIHEFRHVVQIDRTNMGFTKVLSWLTGEQAAAIVNGIFVPSWFMEGDAVCTETVLSNSGRGRVPAFEMLLRAQVNQKGAYSYDKASMGSYKSFVPNQYVLGYSLVANIRRKYGYSAWVRTLDEIARKPFILTPFNHGLKKATGYGKVGLYRMTMFDMDSLWKYQDLHTPKTDFYNLFSAGRGKYENYRHPVFVSDSEIVVMQTSMDDIARFILCDKSGRKTVLATPGFLSSDNFSVAKVPISGQQSRRKFSTGYAYLLAWAETIYDPRWEQRKYSEIRIYNSETGKIRKLTSKSRYFAPAFSPDALAMAAIRVDPTGQCSIVIIDIETGEENRTVVSSATDFFMTPSWSEDGKKIVFTKLDDDGKSILVYNMADQKTVQVISPSFTEISNPVFAGRYLLFNGSYSGIENVYAVDLAGKEVYQVTSSAFGACDASAGPGGKTIVYSDYSSAGYNLVESKFENESWKKLSEVKDYSPSLYKYLVAEEAGIGKPVKADSTLYLSSPYKKRNHIFNFHSWAPAYINYMSGENGTGISFMSQNNLSTATTIVGYRYDMAEGTGKVTADFSWKAWYPIIDFTTSYGGRAAYTDSMFRYSFNETRLSGGFTLPLIFTGGKYYKGLRLQLHTSWTNITDNSLPSENDDRLNGTIHSIDYSFYAYRYIKQSVKDLYPRWGQSFSGSFRHTPFGDNNRGSIASAAARFYFPGVLKHHAIRLDLNLQHRNSGKYPYPDQIILPRGYYFIDENSLACFAVNYKFPFAYPDYSLGSVAYFKRIKANLFYDKGLGKTDGESHAFQSAGIELTSDLHFLRLVFPLDLGFRFGYRSSGVPYFINLLFLVNLSD